MFLRTRFIVISKYSRGAFNLKFYLLFVIITLSASIALEGAPPTNVTKTIISEDQYMPIPLTVMFGLQDEGGKEMILGDIVLTNVPAGAILNVGEVGEGNTWIISQESLVVYSTNDEGIPVAWEISGLTIIPPPGSYPNFNMGLRVRTIHDDDTITTTEGIVEVSVKDDEDALVTVENVSEVKDRDLTINLSTSGAVNKAAEMLKPNHLKDRLYKQNDIELPANKKSFWSKQVFLLLGMLTAITIIAVVMIKKLRVEE